MLVTHTFIVNMGYDIVLAAAVVDNVLFGLSPAKLGQVEMEITCLQLVPSG